MEDHRIEVLRRQLRAHPCHDCPDREDHARWAERYFKLDRDAKTLKRRIEQRTNTIARQFDRVCEVLTALGYLDGATTLTVTDRGRTLMRIYNEMDLVAAEWLRRGCGTAWTPRGWPRCCRRWSTSRAAPTTPSRRGSRAGQVTQVLADMVSIWSDLDALEREHHLDYLREPDLGFAWAAYRWAEGDELDDVLDETDLAAGDFVRWVKQLLDLADQVADAAAGLRAPQGRPRGRGRLRRGVVAYSSVSE